MNCPTCNFACPPHLLFCGMCGTALGAACPYCAAPNPAGFRYCGHCGRALEPTQHPAASLPAEQTPPPSPLGESERRIATVLVSDFVESTPLLEKLGTEEWVELMNRILRLLENQVSRYGGEVSQFRGDGMVAVFGAANPHEDDPERAVLAGLAMQRAFSAHLEQIIPSQPAAAPLRMRVGIHTGEVIVPSGSARQQWEEAAMGLAVAVATRLESGAEPGTVLVSEATHALLGHLFAWQPMPELALKGVSQPVQCWRPLAPLSGERPAPIPALFGGQAPFIGRDAEFRALVTAVRRLFNNEGSVLAISGEKGSGKSYLLRQAGKYFTHRLSLLAEGQPERATPRAWLRGRARSYNQGWPYSIWVDLFNDWFAFGADDPRDEKAARLENILRQLPGFGVESHMPHLARLLGLPLPENAQERLRHLDAEGLRGELTQAVRALITAASRQQPLAITLADLQWADESSLALIRDCLPLCASLPVMFALTFRSGTEGLLQALDLDEGLADRLTNIPLAPLGADEGRSMIESLIGVGVLQDDAITQILYKAGGNPYYISELLRSLVQEGVLASDPVTNTWRVTRPIEGLDLPESLQQLLAASLARLGPQANSVFQVVSVIGPVFWFNLLQTLLPESTTLKADLATLQSAGLIERAGRSPALGTQYHISQPLLRETAYESIIASQRAAIHLRVAQVIEAMDPADVPGSYDGLLAYHYRGAHHTHKELFYTLMAADQARAIFANEEALRHTKRAVELLETLLAQNPDPDAEQVLLGQSFEALGQLRGLLRALGQIDEFKRVTLSLLPLSQRLLADPAWRVDALLAVTEIYPENRDELLAELEQSRQALALSQQMADQQRVARSLIRQAHLLQALKDPAWREMADQALALTRELGDLRSEVDLLLTIARSYGLDSLPRTREYLQTALDRSARLNDRSVEFHLLGALGQLCESEGDYHRQLVEYEQKALAISRQIGNRMYEAQTLMACGMVQGQYLGDLQGGLDLVNESLKVYSRLTGRVFAYLRIAQIETQMGRYSDAWRTFALAQPLADKVYYDIGRAGVALGKAILCNAMGDASHVEQVFYHTYLIHQMTGNNLISRQYQMAASCEESAAHLRLAELAGKRDAAVAQQHHWKALEISHNALAAYNQFGFVRAVESTSEQILYQHGRALQANGYYTDAEEYFRRAWQEMDRKRRLIPAGSPFRKTYLALPLHKRIAKAYKGLKQQ